MPARLLCAAVAGLAAGLAFEPLRLVALLPLAVAALALSCRGATPRGGLLVGSVFGTAFMLTLLPWLQVIGTDAWILLSLVEGLFYGLLGLGTALVVRLPWWPVWSACLWVLVELLRGSVPFGGFPWGRLAFATVDTPVQQLFPLTGAAGATFAVALLGSTLAWALTVVRRAPVRAAAGVLVACLLATAGAWLAPLTGTTTAAAATTGADGEGPGLRVTAVQGDVPGEGMDAFAERRAVLDNHVRTTERYAEGLTGTASRPDRGVWPENATDSDPFQDPTVYDDIQGAVDAVGVPVLVGAMVSGDEPEDVLNQGIVWEPGNGPSQRYSKTHPVPFGEYIPFRDVVARFFSRLDQVPRDMVPGDTPGLLEVAGSTVGDVICFEVAYDDVVREVAAGGADLLVVQTNNATYMGTGQIEQQFAIARLRALETNRSVVVAATNGVSGIVAPDGEVVERAPVRSPATLSAWVPFPGGTTPGVRWGLLLELLTSLVAAGSVSVALGLHYRHRRTAGSTREPVAAGTGEG